MTIDLQAEALAANGRVTALHLRHMEALGVSLRAIFELGHVQPSFGLSPIEPDADGRYQPAEAGDDWLIVPVTNPATFDWFGHPLDTIEFVDLVALRTSEPLRWRWRTGDGWALGEHHLELDAPVEIVATPLEWMARAGRAFCLLDWSLPAERQRQLRNAPPLITSDRALRNRLNAEMAKKSRPLVGIATPGSLADAA